MIQFHKHLLILIGLLGTSCGEKGVQGTSLFSSFQGLTQAEAISPTTIALKWSLDSNFSEYRIYQDEAVSPIKTETFSSSNIEGLSPATIYSYQVSGYSLSEGEKFVGGKYSVKTWERFTGLPSGGVTLASANSIKLTWTMNSPKTSFLIYYKEKSKAWNFSQPTGKVVGNNEYTVSPLVPGKTYCFFVVAEYADGTSEPSTANLSLVDENAPCQILTSTLSNLPSIKVSSVIPGTFPWFWASGGDPSYKIEVFELDTNVRAASRVGNGHFRSFLETPQGRKNYYALVSSGSDVAQVAVNVDTTSGGPVSAMRTRSLNAAGDRGPVIPPILSDGRGQQNLGSKIVSGDFNCDGHADIAASAPSATPFATDRHYGGMGAVVIYYNWQPASYLDPQGNIVTPPMQLKTSPKPSPNAVYPDPLLVTYPVQASGIQLGRSLAVGNFNGDCYLRDDSSPSYSSCNNLFNTQSSLSQIAKIKSCDDLVVTTQGGYFFTIFGDPTSGLVAGSQSNTYGQDEMTCDPASNTCRTSQYNVPAGYEAASFGSAVTSGDYNNDGFDDIAITTNATGVGGGRRILVYRGSGQGVVPFGHSRSHALVDSLIIPLGNTSGTAVVPGDNFGFALGTAFNSRRCTNGSPAGFIFRSPAPPIRKGYDLTKCDDLVIGSPGRGSGRGSIFSCKAVQSFPSTDIPKIASWDCQEHFPDTAELALLSPLVTLIGYGSVITGVPNQNGYPLATNVGASVPSNALPDLAGALFVGAPSSHVGNAVNAGAVFGYYITPGSTDFFSGGIQGVLGASPTGHLVTAVNSVACDRLNRNVTTGSLRHCEHQLLYPSPTPPSARFGSAITTLPDRLQDLDPWMPLLAISSPNRSSSDATGATIPNTGAIYLYRGDISNFGIEGGNQITSPKYYVDNATNYACMSNCTWLSGGISPFGASVVYPSELTANALFGNGGAAGGSFNGDNFADVIASAPGNNFPSSNNGGLFGFFSSQGSFSPSENVPSLSINENVSLEGNYRFEEAKVVGDLNGDGYQDIATHINNNGTWVLVVYYGSAAGLIKNPNPSQNALGNQPLLLRSTQDANLGRQFFKAGDVNGDGFDDLFVIGGNASYIFFGSSSGLIANIVPDIAPVGKNPLRFALSGSNAITFHNDLTLSRFGSLANNPQYNHFVQGVSHGDFNMDGYSDLAVRLDSNSTSLPSSIIPTELDFSATSQGRIVVLYGSPVGPEVNRITGRILTTESGNPADVVVENPCNSGQTPACRVQMLAAPNEGSSFGFALTTRRGLNTASSDPFDGLAVSDPTYNSNSGVVYIYQGSVRGIRPVPIQTLTPRDSGRQFGYSITEAGDINKDSFLDIVVSSGNVGNSPITIFYGAKVGGQNAYFGAGSLNATNYWVTPSILNNAQHLNSSQPRPQVIVPNIYDSQDMLGRGLTALGDFNRDGFADVAVNVPNGDFNLSGVIEQTGYVIIYFGGETGLQTSGLFVSPYPKCLGGATPVCEPYQIFLPNLTAYEFTSLSKDSVGDINGDGLPDLLIGGVGRAHPSGKAISSGVIYVLY